MDSAVEKVVYDDEVGVVDAGSVMKGHDATV